MKQGCRPRSLRMATNCLCTGTPSTENTEGTNLVTGRYQRYGGDKELIYTVTNYFTQAPYCVTFEHDQREKDPDTGLYKTDLDQVYNRSESSEEREKLVAEGRVVTDDLSGKNEWIVQVYEFNDK